MNASDATSSGLRLTIGSEDAGHAMIGHRGPRRVAPVPVNAPMLQYFCGIVEDANDSYWSEAYAAAHWGGLLSPPSMLQSWAIPLPWTPAGRELPTSLAMEVPLPGDKVVNVWSDTEFVRPVRVGDRLAYQEELRAISPQKRSRIGTGHFVETVTDVTNQREELVACVTNSLFRYRTDDQ